MYSTQSRPPAEKGSPHGSVMSCQSLTTATRPFAEPDKENSTTFHRSVRFSSESRGSRRSTESECKRENSGCISLTALTMGGSSHPASLMSQSAPPASTIDLDDLPAPPLPSCRFPKLEDCAHFHYERVSLGGVQVETVPCTDDEPCSTHSGEASDLDEGWICLRVRSHVNDPAPALQVAEPAVGGAGATVGVDRWTADTSDVCEWSLTRSAHNLLQLDDMLHRCIYDRKVSGLLDLSEEINCKLLEDRAAYESLVADYFHHLSIIADDSINCGPILNWLQMDNKGHKLLVANEDSSSINTPAVAAAYSVRKYVSQARDEISFEVGDMISIIDMPGPQESVWWRGKRGFRVGFFPHHCVAVIGDKVPRHMTQPPPIVGSVAVAPIKPVLRKHGKLISLFRSFILSRPSRRSLKQQGILRERVFGCDLGEHLLNCGHDVPVVLVECARVIESRGAVDGIYRLSGGSGLTQRLRAAYDCGAAEEAHTLEPHVAAVARDPHALASLLKMYFRELPNPLCTYQLYESFVSAVQSGPDDAARKARMRDTVVKLPPPHYRTLSYLMRHLRRVSLLGDLTGMTARNMAIVWAPNLLRSPHSQHALQGVAVQAVVTEFLICYAEELFAGEQGEGGGEEEGGEGECSDVTLRGHDNARRPKSMPPHPPTKLLSLEEARRRGKSVCAAPPSPSPCPSPSPGTGAGASPCPPAAVAMTTQLRPSGSMRPKYIEVGSGPNNLPQYHTVLELPVANKRGLKRSPSRWRGLFSRSKLHRPRPRTTPPPTPVITHTHMQDVSMSATGAAMNGAGALRPVKSCESLHSDCDTLAPLVDTTPQLLKAHTRSASCDSYFEPWQAELADMRLRLSPQERDGNIFSEEDDTTLAVANGHQGSLCSSPICSDSCSVEPSPRRALILHPIGDNFERKRSKIEEQLSSIGYIDGGESPARSKPAAEKRHSDEWPTQPCQQDDAKRLCKDRDSPMASLADFSVSVGAVKLRERNSPRKTKSAVRYSGLHQPLSMVENRSVTVHSGSHGQPRMSWHGAKEHSTLIKIDWPIESSVNSLTASTLNSSPMTPITPVYEPLESDSEQSETNRRTINVDRGCDSCEIEKKCLKCELNECPDFEAGSDVATKEFGMTSQDGSKHLHDSLDPSPVHSVDVSYQNLNRLSAVSTNSSGSEPRVARRTDDAYENVAGKLMTSSHESSSSYSNTSPSRQGDELYECYGFTRPSYINLQSSGTSKSSSTSPLKSPLRSTISITFKSPTKSNKNDYEPLETPTNERDSVYEDVDLDKNLSIVEDASVPEMDASLPTQQAHQPETLTKKNGGLMILVMSDEGQDKDNQTDIYSQVKCFKNSVREVNAMVMDSSETKHKVLVNDYENVPFPSLRGLKEAHYENVGIQMTKNCDKVQIDVAKDASIDSVESVTHEADMMSNKSQIEHENGNLIKSVTKNLNVRQLANKFESPTEQKGPFSFDKYKVSTVERVKDEPCKNVERVKKDVTVKAPPPVSPKTYKLSKNSVNARSLDENAFVKEFGCENAKYMDRRKSFDVKMGTEQTKYTPDLNLNLEEEVKIVEESTTPTSENKICLVQRFDDTKPDQTKSVISFDTEKKLSRERIEKYKEERRNFLREKYSSQSFRSSNPEHLTRLKLKKAEDEPTKEIVEKCERLTEGLPKFERRNTVDLGQRMRFSLAKSVNNLDTIQSPEEQKNEFSSLIQRLDRLPESNRKFDSAPRSSANRDRKEKMSPSYNIKDMAAMFEQKSQSSNTG